MNPALLEILRCPVTGSRLRLEGEALVSNVGSLRYPITDGIPQLLPQCAGLPPGVATLEEFKRKFPRVAEGEPVA